MSAGDRRTRVKAATVYFARGSSTLDAKGKAALDVIADVLTRNLVSSSRSAATQVRPTRFAARS